MEDRTISISVQEEGASEEAASGGEDFGEFQPAHYA